MDVNQDYQVALELASALRYEEARQKLKILLSDNPENMEALILLGKVEYYLRLFPSSRRRFETVLTHNPGNPEAYYGLQFFVERKRRIWTVTAWFTSILLLLVIGAILQTSMKKGFHRFEEKIEKQIEHHLEVESETLKKLHVMSENLERYSNELMVLRESTGEWIDVIGKRVGDLDLQQEEQFSKLEDLHSDYYRTILKDLEEITGRLEDGISAEEPLSSGDSSIRSDN